MPDVSESRLRTLNLAVYLKERPWGMSVLKCFKRRDFVFRLRKRLIGFRLFHRWFRTDRNEKQAVAHGGRIRQVQGNLLFLGVHLADAGLHTCVVNNSVGSVQVTTSLVVSGEKLFFLLPSHYRVFPLRSKTNNAPELLYKQKRKQLLSLYINFGEKIE